jgi:hypothetical protein
MDSILSALIRNCLILFFYGFYAKKVSVFWFFRLYQVYIIHPSPVAVLIFHVSTLRASFSFSPCHRSSNNSPRVIPENSLRNQASGTQIPPLSGNSYTAVWYKYSFYEYLYHLKHEVQQTASLLHFSRQGRQKQ